MGLFNKIKNVLFTEEEETTEIPLIQKDDYQIEEEKEKDKVEEEISRFNNIRIEENLNKFEEEKPKVEEVKEEIRPVQKSPFQSFDEEEFDRIAAINKNRLLERDRRAREEKERQNRRSYEERKVEVRIPREETHKFKPTPVISPVYGILDKNYTKDDILPTASSEGTLPKILDIDAVRQKAFGTLDQIENNLEDDSLDDIKITSFDEEPTDNIILPNIETIDDNEEITTPLPKIEDVEKELEKEDVEPIKEEVEEEVTTPEQEDIEVNEAKIESDLFNLIDSMYQEEGDN
jgi:hypothetical protein